MYFEAYILYIYMFIYMFITFNSLSLFSALCSLNFDQAYVMARPTMAKLTKIKKIPKLSPSNPKSINTPVSIDKAQ
jgi:hypothetical protein